jgi:hypothetical protein
MTKQLVTSNLASPRRILRGQSYMADFWPNQMVVIWNQPSDGAVLRHPVGNHKRKVWGAQQQVSLSCETKVYRISRRKPNFRRRCLLALRHFRQRRQKDTVGVKLFTSSNVEPAHNTTKNFIPNLRWDCQSHRFAVNKGLSVSSGKR